MIRLAAKLLGLALLFAAPGAMAQEDPLASVAQAYRDALPQKLGAFTRSKETDIMAKVDPGSYSVVYKIDEGPYLAISVSIQHTGPFDWAARREHLHEMYKGPFFQAGVEGTFTVPGQTDIQTFFGEYGTQMGIRQIWRIKRKDGLEVSVFVAIFKDGYRQLMVDTVAKELFGGAIVTPGAPPNLADVAEAKP